MWTQQFSKRTSFAVALFDYHLRDLIEGLPNEDAGNLYFLNSGAARTRGAEFSLDHVWDQGAIVRASYAYAHAHELESAAVLENSPRQLAKLSFSAPIPGTRLRTGIEARHVSERRGLRDSVDAHTLVNATLTYTNATAGYDVVVSVHNLFDARYADPVGSSFRQDSIEQDGRTYLLRVVRRF